MNNKRSYIDRFMSKCSNKSLFLLPLAIVTISFVTAILENKMRSHLRSRRGKKQSQ